MRNAQHAFLTSCLFSEKHGQQLRQRLKESLPQSSKLARIIILEQNLVFFVFNYSIQETLVKKFKA